MKNHIKHLIITVLLIIVLFLVVRMPRVTVAVIEENGAVKVVNVKNGTKPENIPNSIAVIEITLWDTLTQ